MRRLAEWLGPICMNALDLPANPLFSGDLQAGDTFLPDPTFVGFAANLFRTIIRYCRLPEAQTRPESPGV